MGISWEEAEVSALNRSEWRRSVTTQCIHQGHGQGDCKVMPMSGCDSGRLRCSDGPAVGSHTDRSELM